MGKLLFLAVLGYFLGNLNGAIVVSRWSYRDDVREHGSGNAGLTNFQRTYGGASTLLVLAIDAVKTVAACGAAWLLLRGTRELAFGKMLAGFFVVVGHMYPVLFRFKGGKGVLCCAALALMMDLRVFGILAVLFLGCLALTRYVSLSSCLAALAFPFAFSCFYWGDWGVIALAALLGAYVIYMHRSNLRRLAAGQESRFSLHGKRDGKGTE